MILWYILSLKVIVRVDYWLEWDTTTFVSLQQIVNPDGGDIEIDEPLHCLQWQVLCSF